MMDKYPHPSGKSRASIEAYKTSLQKEWEQMPQEVVDGFCLNFHSNLRSIKDNGGKNNFNA